MLKVQVTVKVAPSNGSQTFKRGHANIINTGMGTEEQGDYYAHFYVDGKSVHSSHISDWPRLERNVWDLLTAALAAPNLLEVPAEQDLPSAGELRGISPDFTGNLATEDYLRSLRSG